MSKLYHVEDIEGKGRGIVASKFIKKGTLILKEIPQIPPIGLSEEGLNQYMNNQYRCTPEQKSMVEGFLKKLVSGFYQMKKSDQEEYLELQGIERNGLEATIRNMERNEREARKIFKIVDIYFSNFFRPDGFRIRSSLFNHSCYPNATEIWSPVSSTEVTHEIRAIADIKPGQEITFNNVRNDFPGLRRKEIRQKIILARLKFTCLCDFCKDDDDDDGDTEDQTKIDKLMLEIQMLNIHGDEKAASEAMIGAISIDNCTKEIARLKQLYTLGKKKKCHPEYLFKMVEHGYHQASIGYVLSPNAKQRETFEKEAVNFAKAAEKFGKILGKEYVEPELWKKFHQNFRTMVNYRY